MYFSFKDIKVSGSRGLLCSRIAMCALILLLLSWIAEHLNAPTVALTAFIASYLCGILALFIVVPGIFLALAFILAPAGLAILGIIHDHQWWKTWWFWVVTAICEIVGGFILAWFDPSRRK